MPDSFFYLTPLDTEDRRLWLQQIILDHQVYFRSRQQLNDPNELRPRLVFEGTGERIRGFVQELIQQRWPVALSEAEYEREVDRLVGEYQRGAPWVEGLLHETLDRIGVFCVSATPTANLMWAHYAGGHRGACVEFDANAGLFLSAQPVTYVDEAPVINRLVDSASAILEKSMFTKGVDWKYEEEWRVIARWHDPDRAERHIAQHRLPAPLEEFMRQQHGPGHYEIPGEAVRSVILGSRIGAETEAWIQALISWLPLGVAIRRASLSGNGSVAIR